jgi:hypothetical protein
MFTTPQQRRGMARMPQGILASGPRIMNAAMQRQEPVRMNQGGSFTDFLNQYVLGPNTQIGGSPNTDESATLPPSAPGVGDTSGTGNRRRRRNPPAPNAVPPVVAAPPVVPTGDMPGAEDIPSNQPGDVNFGPEVGAEDAPTSTAPSINLTEQFDDLVESRPPTSGARSSGAGEGSSLSAAYADVSKALKELLPSGEPKSTGKYIDDAKKIFEDYGITAPDLKSRRDLRIMEFFLNMAAGQSPDFLTNVGQAGKEAFKGYAEDVKTIDEATRAINLAAVQMGQQKEATDAASVQAVTLKGIDLASDIAKAEIDANSPTDKERQVNFLVDSGKSRNEAIDIVFGGDDTKLAYEMEFSSLLRSGHSRYLATRIAGNSIDMEKVREGGQEAGKDIARIIGRQNLTEQDKNALGLRGLSMDEIFGQAVTR